MNTSSWGLMRGLSDFSWMTICQSRISPFGKVCRGSCISTFTSSPGENHILRMKKKEKRKKKARLKKWGFVSIPLKARKKKTKKKRAAPPPKKATAHKSIAQSGTIKPSLSCEGGHVHFFFHDWGKHNAGEEKKQSAKTIDSLGFLYVPPSVCEMSTKAEQCKYGGVFWVPVCAFFSPPVLSWWGREGGGDLQAGNVISFFFFFFDLEPRKKKKKRMKGSCPWWWNRGIRGRLQHVLSLQRMARGAQSTRGASVHTFLHVHLCVSRAWWAGEIIPFRRHVVHLYIIFIHSLLIDVVAWGACGEKKARCAAGFKVDLGGRFLYWRIWWR